MTANSTSRTEPRSRLSRDRVLRAALAHADAVGLDGVSMRNLAELLGVAPMALYRHVANREDLIDGLIDLVFAEIEVPGQGRGWKDAMRRRAIDVRDVLLRHRWAIGLMESRLNPGAASLRHHDAVLGCLRAAGFDVAMAAHAYSVLDSYIFGFALTQMSLPFETGEDVAEVAREMLAPFPEGEYPNLVEFISQHAMKPGYDYADEFEYGLDLILDGLDEATRRAGPGRIS